MAPQAKAPSKPPAVTKSPPVSVAPPATTKPAGSPPGGNAAAAEAAKVAKDKGETKEVVAVAPKTPIELQGMTTFTPSPELAKYIEQRGQKGAQLPVKFGNVSKAGGIIHVASSGKTFQTVGAQVIPIDHPFLSPLAPFEPVLRIKMQQSAISGFAAPKAASGDDVGITKHVVESASAFGLAGFKLGLPKFHNAIEGGNFNLGTPAPVAVKLAGWVDLSLDLGLVNDKVRFSVNGQIAVRGLGKGELKLTRDDHGAVSGHAELPVSLAKFTGKAVADYVNGDLSITGTLSYATDKLHGSMTVVVMEAAKAEAAARGQIDPEKAATETTSDDDKKPEKFKSGERAIAGWGELDFAFTDWFTGKAKAVFDPGGYITVIGKIAPPKSIELLKEHVWNTRLFGTSISARYGVPYVADIHVGFGIELGAVARIGPATLSDIVVEGKYSTNPEVSTAFSITGAFRISAYAGLNLRFEGKAGLTLLGHDIDLGAAITGKAGVKGYAEAKPTLGYREKDDAKAGKKGEYFLKGHLEIAAQPFVGLDGELFVRLDSPWWSPAPDKTWTWPLFSLEYPLPGEFGIAADIDYVIGSGKMPDIKWGKADFDASKFTDSLLDDQIPKKKVGDQDKAGKWKGEQPAATNVADTKTKTDGKGAGAKDAKTGANSGKSNKGNLTKQEADSVLKTPDASKRWLAGMEALGKLHTRAEKAPEDEDQIHDELAKVKKDFGFTRLDATAAGDYWDITADMNPNTNKAKKTPATTAKRRKNRGWLGKKGEGEAGTFSTLQGDRGDNVTPHHMPQNRVMEIWAPPNYSHGKGVSFNMEAGRHMGTRSYGGRGKASAAADATRDPARVLQDDIDDVVEIYDKSGLLKDHQPEISSALAKVRALNESSWPTLFGPGKKK